MSPNEQKTYNLQTAQNTPNKWLHSVRHGYSPYSILLVNKNTYKSAMKNTCKYYTQLGTYSYLYHKLGLTLQVGESVQASGKVAQSTLCVSHMQGL